MSRGLLKFKNRVKNLALVSFLYPSPKFQRKHARVEILPSPARGEGKEIINILIQLNEVKDVRTFKVGDD